MDVEAEIFARSDLTHVGIAPLTSMFLFDQTNRERFSDFRPAVHDSDGLMISNGAGEIIWWPLANPTALQVSAFADENPRGFGLMQRPRAFGDYADLEALYHKRPALWVTPGEGWGKVRSYWSRFQPIWRFTTISSPIGGRQHLLGRLQSQNELQACLG